VSPGSPPPQTPGAPGAPVPAEGLSGGWIFIIVLSSVLVAYVGGGFAYNIYLNDLSGLEACPHLRFWVELPGLVRDGCVVSYAFTRDMLMSTPCMRRSQYQEVGGGSSL
jgi:hypothetical protein